MLIEIIKVIMIKLVNRLKSYGNYFDWISNMILFLKKKNIKILEKTFNFICTYINNRCIDRILIYW